MKTLKNARCLTLFLAVLCLSQGTAYAVFNLTVSPRRGGQSIRFEPGQPGGILRNEEVTLTVTTDRAVQYHILQTLYQPLTNEMGQTIPQSDFVVFSPTNSLGTLKTELESPVTMGQVPIYTSNAAGDSDEFLLVYNVKVAENQPGGVYHSRVTFTAQPVSATSGASPSITTMDVRVEIRPTFRVTLSSMKGGKSLDLGKISKNNPTATAALKVEIESNIGSSYRFIQQLTEPLVSQEGVFLDEDSILLSIAGGKNGSPQAGAGMPLSPSPQVIYTSNDGGAGDILELQYSLTPDSKQKAGIYSGNLSFKAESASGLVTPQTMNIPVRFEAEPIFYLDVEPEQGGNLHFGTFKSDIDKQARKVLVTVHSNLGQPYQVLQVVARKLVNAEGAALPKENFTFFGSDAQSGTLAVMSPKPVSEGQSAVFTSNPAGDPEKFTLNYELKVPPDAKSGAYNSEVNYTITTL